MPTILFNIRKIKKNSFVVGYKLLFNYLHVNTNIFTSKYIKEILTSIINKMQAIKLNNNKYILANYILEHAPIYSKGIRSGKDLLRKKGINEYIFGRLVDNKWIQTDGKSAKFDKVLIKYDYVQKIDELQGKKTADDNGIEQAPDIINLANNEKFQDETGNIIEIETRGERNVDKIYFKVKDIAIGFSMERLQDVLIDKTKQYDELTHYKYFVCIKK
jgi:hypothetical protein